MRAKIRPFILASFCCAQLVPGVAFAGSRPTHTLSHEPRRVVPTPMRPGHHEALHGPSRGHSTASGGHSTTGHHGAAAHSGRASKSAEGSKSAKNQAHAAAPVHGRRGAKKAAAGDAAAGRDAAADRDTARRVHEWEQTQHRAAADSAPAGADAAAQPDATAPVAPEVLAAAALTPVNPAELPRTKSIEEEAATPVLLPSLYDKRGRLVVPPPLYGSHDVLVHQNMMAERDGLTRVADDDDLEDLRRQHKLVSLPASETLHVDDRLPANRRFSRPWTAQFLTILGHDFYASFREPLQVNSAVRTVRIQEHLLRTNGNAAPISGDTASPHLTGQAVDIGKRGLSMVQIAWMRAYLQPLIEQGKIDVEEEFQQSCFHISVYKSYSGPSHAGFAGTALAKAAAAN